MEVGLDMVQGDMRVYGSDGEDLGMAAGVTSDPSTNPPTRYLEVNRSVFLGLAGDDLWIPESAIASIVLGGDIRLTCTRDEALERYRDKPASAI